MLIPRNELEFNFKGAQFDLSREQDLKLIGWILDQFLYGEVTGIQCGYWLYRAPHLQAAQFLAKQASEELSHVKRILRIQRILGLKPKGPFSVIRFLSTGMMGGSWGEHVAIEMAVGEGLVLTVFYVLSQTIPQEEVQKILESALVEEERHVEFGEKETLAWLKRFPQDRKYLLSLVWIQLLSLRVLKRFVIKRLLKQVGEGHPVLSQFSEFYDHVLKSVDMRVQKLGLSDRPLNQLSFFTKLDLVLGFPFRKLRSRFRRSPKLTETYLSDPMVLSEMDLKTREGL